MSICTDCISWTFHRCVSSYAFSNCQSWMLRNYIECIYHVSLHHVFSCVPSELMHKRRNSYIGCNCRASLRCVFACAPSGLLHKHRSNCTGCTYWVSLHYVSWRDTSDCLSSMLNNCIDCICALALSSVTRLSEKIVIPLLAILLPEFFSIFAYFLTTSSLLRLRWNLACIIFADKKWKWMRKRKNG